MHKVSVGTIGLTLVLGIAVCITVYVVGMSFAPTREAEWTDPVMVQHVPQKTSWNIQSIDTMKQSRDLARGKAHDTAFDQEIAWQVKAIAETGANYIALATPYDKEFLPFLRRWVQEARAHKLNIWFRGNWSGWEGWFDYPKTVSRAEHIRKTVDFISNNSDLFQDGDILSPCPECENGGPGDPRQTGDIDGYRKFVIEEYQQSEAAFSTIGKKVRLFYPSNRDVAKLIMDPATTRSLGGYVIIDHHIGDAEKMATDLRDIVASSGGKVVLGEFGVPELDTHGKKMTEKGKMVWMDTVLESLLSVRGLEGVNYWVNTVGPTALWKETGEPLPTVSLLTDYFSPHVLSGRVTDEYFCALPGAKIVAGKQTANTNYNGYFEMRSIGEKFSKLAISADGFNDQYINVSANDSKINAMLTRKNKGAFLQEKWLFEQCLK